MKKVFVLVCTVLLLLSTGSFFATEPSQSETKSLMELIQEQTDPSLYTYLQNKIDESFLPGYQVAGKVILECYCYFNFEASDKTLTACMQRADSPVRYYIILDSNRYHVLVKYDEQKIYYQYDQQPMWEPLCKMFEEMDTVAELDGEKRTITGITCFYSPSDGVVIYFQTTEGIFVRHFGYGYKQTEQDEALPHLTPADYTLDEFTEYTNRFTQWNKSGTHCSICTRFSGYMSEGAPAPMLKTKERGPILTYVWCTIAGVILIGGTGVGLLLYRRKRRCTS